MKLISYNRKRNDTIRGIVAMIVSLLPFSILSIIDFFDSLDKSALTVFEWVCLGLALAAAVVIRWFINFEEVIEVLDNGRFLTYFKIGIMKFSQKLYSGPKEIVLEQDAKRYFCVTLRTLNNENLVLEKIPTLKQANERLEEVKAIFR
jgi:hypothetical protein